MDNLRPEQHAPTALNVTVASARKRQVRHARPRDYLTEREIERLIDAADGNRWGHRDATAMLLAYRHGLRASELVALRWDDVDFQAGKLHVRRSKGGTPSVHPIGGRELRALRRLQREGQPGRYVFVSERLAPLSVAGYQRMVARAGEAAGFPFLISSHVLRHSCGYKLANDGRDTRSIQHYLGHKSIASTVRYTALAPVVSRISGRIDAGTAGAASLLKPKGVEGENKWVPSHDCSLPPDTSMQYVHHL